MKPELPALKTFPVTRLRNDQISALDDELLVEEPLEIRLNGRRFTATMRTPGHDGELARGLLFTEGIIESDDDIEALNFRTRCREFGHELVNIVEVTLHDVDEIAPHLWERSLISNASCGLCGKASIEAMTARVSALPDHAPIAREVLLNLTGEMNAQQSLFRATGGSHAAAIFDANGNCRGVFEDIGRHNATDKIIGCGLQNGWLPAPEKETLILLVSGRASFEIVQKALMARIAVVCSVSAASSLAVELARANHQTLIGFVRERGLTIYCGDVG